MLVDNDRREDYGLLVKKWCRFLATLRGILKKKEKLQPAVTDSPPPDEPPPPPADEPPPPSADEPPPPPAD